MENITAGNFSYVTFAVKSQVDKAMLEDYIVFEPVRENAEALAKAFAAQRYGDKLQEMTVYPRNYKRKARDLFQHGKILTALRKGEETNSIKDEGNISEKLSTADTNVEFISDETPQDDALEITEPANGHIGASATLQDIAIDSTEKNEEEKPESKENELETHQQTEDHCVRQR